MVRANHLSLSAGLGIDLSSRMLCSSSYEQDELDELCIAVIDAMQCVRKGIIYERVALE